MSRRNSKNIPGWGDDDGDNASLSTSLLSAEHAPSGDIQLSSVTSSSGGYDTLQTNDPDDGFTGRRLSSSNAVVFPTQAGPGGRTTRGNSEADKQRISNDALARQQANNDKFMAQLKQEEDAFLARIKQKKATEDADAAYARQLQEQEEAALGQHQQRRQQQQQPGGGGSGGGGGAGNGRKVRITIPNNANAGDVLRINVPGVGLRDIIVPTGVQPNTPVEFLVEDTKKTTVRVTLPQNTQPGAILTIKIPKTQESVQVAVPENAVPGATLQFEVASSRVPPPVHAVGHSPQLGGVAAIYGNQHPQPQQPRRRRRDSSGVSVLLLLLLLLWNEVFLGPRVLVDRCLWFSGSCCLFLVSCFFSS